MHYRMRVTFHYAFESFYVLLVGIFLIFKLFCFVSHPDVYVNFIFVQPVCSFTHKTGLLETCHWYNNFKALNRIFKNHL